jgi:hypothetical protein
MTYTQVQVEPLKGDGYGSWTVEAIGDEGEIEQTIFAGPNAEQRARRHASKEYGGEK